MNSVSGSGICDFYNIFILLKIICNEKVEMFEKWTGTLALLWVVVVSIEYNTTKSDHYFYYGFKRGYKREVLVSTTGM